MSSTTKQTNQQQKTAEINQTNQDQQYTEKQYRAIQKQIPKLERNSPPVCKDKRSYELIIRRIASDTGKAFYECENCGKITPDYSNLNKHCRLHMGEKPFKCDVREKAFSDRSGYDVHCRTHSEMKPHKRDARGKTLRTSSNLKFHSCAQKISYGCWMCGKNFPSLEKLYQHCQGELYFYLPV